MSKISRVINKIIKRPSIIIDYMFCFGFFNFLPDDKAAKLLWKVHFKEELNLSDPKTFNEKLQWLKVYDHKDEYTRYVDKYLVRDYVKEKIGEEYLIPLLGVWENANDINFEELPEQFVIKCNHNSGGGMCICKDKKNIDINKVVKNLNKCIKNNYYYKYREWAYKNVTPLIIAEELMEDHNINNDIQTDGLIDYKFYCFNGEPKFLYVGFANISDGIKKDVLSFLDLNWEPTPFYRRDHKPIPFAVQKPDDFDDMIEIARKLSDNIPFVRVDLYYIDNRIFFSEMTMCPGSGFGKFYPEEWERKLGDWLVLPGKSN